MPGLIKYLGGSDKEYALFTLFQIFDISLTRSGYMTVIFLYILVLEGLQNFTRLQIGDCERVQARKCGCKL